MVDNYYKYITKNLRKINELKFELSRLRMCYADLLEISSIDISDGIKVSGTNKITSITEERAIKRVEIENRIRYLEDKIKTFEISLTKLPETQGKLLTMRFVEGYKITTISDITGYNYDYVRKVIKMACTKLTCIILKDIIAY